LAWGLTPAARGALASGSRGRASTMAMDRAENDQRGNGKHQSRRRFAPNVETCPPQLAPRAEAAHISFDAGEAANDLGDLTGELLLPPAVVAVNGLGTLPHELWKRIGMCLEPRSLCRAGCASDALQSTLARDAAIWAQLCLLHFPRMYQSVIAAERPVYTAPTVVPTKLPKSARKQGRRKSQRRGSGSEPTFEVGNVEADMVSEATTSASPSPSMTPMTPPSPPQLREQPETRMPPSTLADSVEQPAEACNAIDGCDVDWKALYAKRWQKKLQWDAIRRQSVRDCDAQSGYPQALLEGDAEPTSKRSVSELSARELGRLTDSTSRLKICTLCGEKYSPGEARRQPFGCCYHAGVFQPVQTAGWSRSDLKQLHQHARQALKNAGGASWEQRHPRASRGHGHWTKGLGLFSGDKVRFIHCLDGQTPAVWSCCAASQLFSEGCKRGMHRHFH